jgi:uncharacterized protein (TIGR00369 family)
MSAISEEARAFIIRELNAQGMFAHLGCELLKVEPGSVTLAMPFHKQVAQQHGFFHGGAVGFLIDDATAAAAATTLRAGQSLLTAEYKVNFVAPAQGERLVCHAEVVKAGSTIAVVEAKCFVVKAGDEKLCAVGLASMAVIAAKPLTS